MMQAVVFGNVTLDILCCTVDDVPRNSSISFEHSIVSPGGCGSNVAIGLQALEVPTALVACMGTDVPSTLLEQYWSRWGLDCRYVRKVPDSGTGISVGLIDSQAQPRFIHTTGANRQLSATDLKLGEYVQEGAKVLHVAGYFVLPGVLDAGLGIALQQARELGLITSLDVVHSPRMDHPEPLWACLPHLDYFLCNQKEAALITGLNDYYQAGALLRKRGAQHVIIKLGETGCWVDSDSLQALIPGLSVPVVDTTGAGDAFAAGLIAGLVRGKDLAESCLLANQAGARIVGALGAIAAWEV